MHLTKVDSYHLGRYLAGAPSINMEALSGPEVHAAAQALLAANGGDRSAALRHYLEDRYGRPVTEQIVREIVATRVDGPPPADPAQPELPALPPGVLPDPALARTAAPWLDRYVAYASQVSPMTPRLFHEAAGLYLAGVAVARRVVLHMSYGPVYPNLFILWLAPTTLFRKTTGLEVAERLAQACFPHLFRAQDATPEALFADMAGVEPTNMESLDDASRSLWQARRHFAAQRGLLFNEMSGLLARAMRDYNAGLIESLLDTYDCKTWFERHTQRHGMVAIRSAYLSILGASTPAAMASYLASERLWNDGWWSRFALLTPDQDPAWIAAQPAEEPPELAAGLLSLYRRLPAPVWPDAARSLSATLGREVLPTWERYNQAVSFDLVKAGQVETRLHGTYGRLPTQVLKIAMALAALDWPADRDAPRIELPHLARAIHIAEGWRASAHRTLRLAGQNAFTALRDRIIRQFALRSPRGASVREIYKAIRDKRPKEVADLIAQLAEVGELECMPTDDGKRGKPTTRYRLARE